MAENYDANSIDVLEGLEPVRKRPGMYIGGTDERALHHMAAEIFDNSMDEAVAGHASVIMIELLDDRTVRVTDNGRGIPVEPHPKFPGRSTLEVVLCTLHAGGKFGGSGYEISGGLHGVGASVVNALSELMVVDVSRNGAIWRQSFSRGVPKGGVEKIADTTKRGTRVTFRVDEEIFTTHRFKPSRLMKMAKSKAYLFPGVEIRWRTAVDDGETPLEGKFHFTGGLKDYLDETLEKAGTISERHFSGSVDFNERFGVPGKVEWALNWAPARDGFSRSWCNAVPTPDGGTHENGFWSAILKGVKSYGEKVAPKKAALIAREDLVYGGCALISSFIREPQFVGQTKDRLATADAQKWVEGAVRDRFDNWLVSDTKMANAIFDYLVTRAEERLRRREEKDAERKSATKRTRLPAKLADCSRKTSEGTELFLVEGDSAGGSAKMARRRETQAIMPLRGKVLNVLGSSGGKLSGNAELNDLCQAIGTGMGSKFVMSDMRYDRIVIMTDADVDGAHIASLLITFFFDKMRPLIEAGRLYLACPPLYRLTQGARRVYVQTDAEKDEVMKKGLGGKGQISVQRFKGLGEMDASDLKDTTMNPESRRLIRIGLDREDLEDAEAVVDRLMGKRPEARFAFIQENARFAEDLDV